MVTFKSKVDFRGFNKKIERLKKALLKEGLATVSDIAEMGKAHAKRIAPYNTGKTARLIRAIKRPTSDGAKATIISPNSTPNRGGFNLVKWMHSTRGVLRSDNTFLLAKTNGRLGHAGDKIIKTGSPTYMYRTTEWLKGLKTQVAKSHFNKIKIR